MVGDGEILLVYPGKYRVPNANYIFVSWSTTAGITVANNISSTTTATITSPSTITANFFIVPENTSVLIMALLMTAISMLAITFKRKNTVKRGEND